MSEQQPQDKTPTILALSSWVGAGHVGLSAAAPVLQRLGRAVIQLPTIVLSNHKAWPQAPGAETDPALLVAMAEAIAANGLLASVETVLVGYLPSAAHVEAALAILDIAQAASVVCDPVMGDDPKGLYVPRPAAEALRERLAPRADILTPNRFELSWLAERPVETLAEAVQAARSLAAGRVFVTSPPGEETGVLSVDAAEARLYRAPRLSGVPNGPGDVFAALIAAGHSPSAALGKLGALIDASLGAPHLRIVEAAEAWLNAPAAFGEAL